MVHDEPQVRVHRHGYQEAAFQHPLSVMGGKKRETPSATRARRQPQPEVIQTWGLRTEETEGQRKQQGQGLQPAVPARRTFIHGPLPAPAACYALAHLLLPQDSPVTVCRPGARTPGSLAGRQTCSCTALPGFPGPQRRSPPQQSKVFATASNEALGSERGEQPLREQT